MDLIEVGEVVVVEVIIIVVFQLGKENLKILHQNLEEVNVVIEVEENQLEILFMKTIHERDCLVPIVFIVNLVNVLALLKALQYLVGLINYLVIQCLAAQHQLIILILIIQILFFKI